MIPRAHIDAWRAEAPWSSDAWVEQDLVISRALVAIFQDDLLVERLAFRGGTALYKLHLRPVEREVRVSAGPGNVGSRVPCALSESACDSLEDREEPKDREEPSVLQPAIPGCRRWQIVPTFTGASLLGGEVPVRVPVRQALSGVSEPAEGQPPLAIVLDEVEYDAVVGAVNQGASALAAAFTHYGPEAQDKLANEDFALGAHAIGQDGEDWAIAVVADGVSTRTFWASRASRLASFAAVRAARLWLLEAGGDVSPFSDASIDELQTSLEQEVRRTLGRDRRRLLELDAVPPGWNADLFRRTRGDVGLWYSSTLLVAVASSHGGVILICGDGAVVVERHDSGGAVYERKVALQTDDSVAIDSFVSLAPDTLRFQTVRVLPRHGDAGFRIILATDGVDRSRARSGVRAEDFYQFAVGPEVLPDPGEIVDRALRVPIPDADNHSAAILCVKTIHAPAPGKALGVDHGLATATAPADALSAGAVAESSSGCSSGPAGQERASVAAAGGKAASHDGTSAPEYGECAHSFAASLNNRSTQEDRGRSQPDSSALVTPSRRTPAPADILAVRIRAIAIALLFVCGVVGATALWHLLRQ